MTMDKPLEEPEDPFERLRRISTESSNALDVESLLQDISALSLVDQLADFISIKDCEGRFVFCNQVICRTAGLKDGAALFGKTDFDIYDETTAGRLFALERQVMASGSPVEKHEEAFRLADGRRLWLSISKSALRDRAGRIIGLVSVSRDITERKQQEELRHGHARLLEMIARGQLLDVVLDAVVRLAEEQLDDVQGSVMLLDEEGRHLFGAAAPSLAPAFIKMLDRIEIGVARGSCGTAAWRGAPVIVKDVLADPLWEECCELGTTFGFRSCWSTPIIGADARILGTFALYSPTVREPNALEQELMAMATDLAGIAIERADSERRISHMAHHDQLTGLANRTLFWNRFSRMLQEAERQGSKVAVAYLDIDNFKGINDSLGHAAGDEVLRTLASRMSRSVRADDLLGRLGGDEFAIVFGSPVHDRNGVLRRLRQLRSLMAEPIVVEGSNVVATCSMGVAFFPDDGAAPDELLARADRSMYEAKSLGRDRLVVSP
jgi:diguanylate cyclase (GGDEF)-like protein/PAS domain S-box-containing protein